MASVLHQWCLSIVRYSSFGFYPYCNCGLSTTAFLYIYNRGLKAWFAISILLKRLGNQSIFYSGVLLQFLLLFIARFAISISTHCLICQFYFTHPSVCNSLFVPIAWFVIPYFYLWLRLQFSTFTNYLVCNSQFYSWIGLQSPFLLITCLRILDFYSWIGLQFSILLVDWFANLYSTRGLVCNSLFYWWIVCNSLFYTWIGLQFSILLVDWFAILYSTRGLVCNSLFYSGLFAILYSTRGLVCNSLFYSWIGLQFSILLVDWFGILYSTRDWFANHYSTPALVYIKKFFPVLLVT